MEQKNNCVIKEKGGTGSIHIADSVIMSIAELAIAEVEGVQCKKGSKGIQAEIVDNVVSMDLTLSVAYGKHIPETCQKVQTKIKGTIESMTGLVVKHVHIRVNHIAM